MSKPDRTDEEVKSLYGYNVQMTRATLHEERSSERYGSWSASYLNNFKELRKGDKYPDVLSTFDFKSGDVAYLVWIEWSSGDSFGNGERQYTESIGLFDSYAAAEELSKALREFDPDSDVGSGKDWSDSHRFSVVTSDGQKFEYGFAPWVGYFENLDEVHIETTTVLKKR